MKLIKVYETIKSNPVFFYYFFLYIKVLTGYYKKTKKSFKKRLVKGIKIFQKKKEKGKYVCGLYRNLSERKIFIMVVNDIEILQKVKKKMFFEYRKNYSRMQKLKRTS